MTEAPNNYFAIDADGDMHYFRDHEEAKQACEDFLWDCKGPDGWERDDLDILSIQWGQLRGQVVHLPADEDEWNFELVETS